MGRFMQENRRMLAEMRVLLDEMERHWDGEQSIDAAVILPASDMVVPAVEGRFHETFARLGMEVSPLNEVRLQAGDVAYVLKDFWTTELGSWEVGQHKDFGLPQWARDAYLRPYGDSHYFDDAGADHHLFGAVLDEYGYLIPSFSFVFAWPDGQAEGVTKHHSGWANQAIYSKYNPDAGERGAWSWWPNVDGHVEAMTGASLPFGRHVSFFAVWQRVVVA